MKIEIKNRWTTEVMHTVEAETLRDAVEQLCREHANLGGADLRDANLGGASLIGANLGGANLRDANLGGANLGGADLGGASLIGADLGGANLGGADLGGANLRDANLGGASLIGANLGGANLGGADLRGANLGDLAPHIAVPQLHTKILAAIEAGGELDMSSWHTCETTHCRAGWAIHLAGAPGKVLEACYGPSVAGALIHLASCGWMEKVPDFSASNEAALADIRECAAKEVVSATSL